jgi:hypothetical protein
MSLSYSGELALPRRSSIFSTTPRAPPSQSNELDVKDLGLTGHGGGSPHDCRGKLEDRADTMRAAFRKIIVGAKGTWAQ